MKVSRDHRLPPRQLGIALALGAVCFLTAAARTPVETIYRDGWIDLNKNGP